MQLIPIVVSARAALSTSFFSSAAIRHGKHHYSASLRSSHNTLASSYTLSHQMSSLASTAHVPSSGRVFMDAISISDTYDGGNGEFVSLRVPTKDDNDDCDLTVNVKIRPDPFTEFEQKQHYQYFSFRSTLNANSSLVSAMVAGGGEDNKSSIKVRYVIENAGNASFAGAYHGYSTFVTTQSTPFLPDSWTRTSDTSVSNDGSLTWTHVHENNESSYGGAYFAYFPPYSYERHLGLIAKCAQAGAKSGLWTVKTLGQTLMGREIDCVTVGTGSLTCWVICRQHPGETMASFYVEGLLNRLLGLDDEGKSSGPIDAIVERAIDIFTFHIVPNVNPDGSVAGYLRTNAAGSNLNREWATVRDDYIAPSLDKSPEVLYILREMDKSGVDAFLDIHGDEALPFNFLSGSEGMSVWGPRLKSLHGAFLASYERANSDMQGCVSYDPDGPGDGMPNICSNQIAERFGCFSGTLEMPFKELTTENKNQLGWGPERARRLGALVLESLCHIAPNLRNKSEFWEGLSEEDAYVKPSSKYETLALSCTHDH